MSSEETDTGDSSNSVNDVHSLNDDFARMQFESSSSEEDNTIHSIDCYRHFITNEIISLIWTEATLNK